MGIDNKTCATCFYDGNQGMLAPCTKCTFMDKWVDRKLYIRKSTSPDFRPLKEVIDTWISNEDFPTDYDVVSKPKHYMLFDPDEAKTFAYLMTGIEVRDVIEKLVDKLYKSYETPKNMPMALADYVQMMQYLMRFMDKNGVEDLKKARWYLDKLVEAYEHPQLDT